MYIYIHTHPRMCANMSTCIRTTANTRTNMRTHACVHQSPYACKSITPLYLLEPTRKAARPASGRGPPEKASPPGFRVNWSELDDYGLVIEGWLPLPARASSPGLKAVPLWGVGYNPSSVSSFGLQNTPEGKKLAPREKMHRWTRTSEGWLPLPTSASSPGLRTVPLWGKGCNPASATFA